MAYSSEEKTNIVDKICEDIVNGSALRNAIKSADISFETFYRWIDEDESKSKQYTRATELRAETMAEELLSIADAGENDVIVNEEGVPVTNHHVIQRDRLRVDARKFLMAKMQPKKYGDKIDVTSGNKPIDKPFVVEIIQPKKDE